MSVRSIEAEVSIKSGVQAECTIGREVIVEVHDDVNLQPLVATENGEYFPDEGVDGYSQVTVNTPVDELQQEIQNAKVISGCDPLIEGITSLTTYANEVTGQSDETLSDAVETLASKYGKTEFNFAKYFSNCSSLFRDAVLPETVELDFTGNITAYDFTSAFFRTSGVKHIVIKNLISDKLIGFGSFLYISSDVVDLTFENCSFTANSFESLGRSCGNLEAIYGELDCSKITSGNGLSFWGSPKFREYRIKPNTINFGKANANFGSYELSNETITSIANGLNPLVADQSLYLANVNKVKLNAILGTNDNGTFIADENGSMTLMDFITTVKGWTVT